ncbi:hypothetical protein [Cupriavidus sp. a3]|uniref:hypothetical protein n=1 Tax=Cupriavidus sp. a3 TaxID=3242158 RepID=UPI003D9C3CBA
MKPTDHTFVVTYQVLTGKCFLVEVNNSAVVQLGPFEADETTELAPVLFPNLQVVRLVPQECKLDDEAVFVLGNAALMQLDDAANASSVPASIAETLP